MDYKKYPKPTYETGIKLESINDPDNKLIEGYYGFECPGCKHDHFINVNPKVMNLVWDFDFNFKNPTVSPSILNKGNYKDTQTICHLFIKNGRIEYLNDCTHHLSGRTIDMIDVVKV